MSQLSRRGLFGGLGFCLFAPAIVRRGSLMELSYRPTLQPVPYANLLSLHFITREAIQLWKNQNHNWRWIDTQELPRAPLRIRLPIDYRVNHKQGVFPHA